MTDWIFPRRRGYRMTCCDCGLTHVVDFKLFKMGRRGHAIAFRVDRDEQATRKNPTRKKLEQVLALMEIYSRGYVNEIHRRATIRERRANAHPRNADGRRDD